MNARPTFRKPMGRNILRALPAVLVLTAACSTLRGDLPQVGTNPGAPIWAGSILFTNALATDIATAGGRIVRINFRIDGNATWTPQHLAKYDTIIATARAHNMQVLGLICYEAVVGGQAQWNENYNTTGMNPYIANFAQTAYTLINRYKNDVKLFELWNEPDCWSVPPASNPLEPGCYYIWPRCYANLLAETYKECIAQGGAGFFSTHGVSLVTGGLFAHDISGSFSTSRPYMTDVYDQTDIWDAFETSPLNPTGRRYPWDFFGYHFYLNQGQAVSTYELGLYFNDIRTMKALQGDAAPLLVTEFGWNTQAVSTELQAANLRETYNWLRSQADVRASLWYQWNDGDGGWGLVYSIGNPKPSYYEFAAQCGAQPLVANFTGHPLAGEAPLAVQFSDTSIGVVDTWSWTFGDNSNSQDPNPQHVYASPGQYTVSLTVTGPGGQDSETKVNYVTVGVTIDPADLDADGDVDLADAALFAPCFTGSGVTTPPPGCECGATVVAPMHTWEGTPTLAGLSQQIASGDLLHGQLGSIEAGGFYQGLNPPADLADLTDGVAGANTEAVLADYARPALQVRYDFASPVNIGRINVFAENSDGRVFQNYDVAYSAAGSSNFQTLITDVTTGPFGQNNDAYDATLTTVTGQVPGALALSVDALRFTFYDVSTISPPGIFWDEWDSDEPGDADGNPRAYVGSIIKEIDVFAAPAGNRADLDADGDADVQDFDLLAVQLAGPQ